MATEEQWRTVASLFDATVLWPSAPLWHAVRDAHAMGNIRATFIAAALVGREQDLEYLAGKHWPAEMKDGALGQLERLYRSARLAAFPDSTVETRQEDPDVR